MRADNLFAFPESIPFRDFFSPHAEPWEWVKSIRDALSSFEFPERPEQNIPAGVSLQGKVYLHPTVKLPAYATIEGPCYIGEGTEIRPGAYIRGNVITGANCVLGNSCEYKNCLLLDNVETAHFNYVGDSVLGNKAHLGAGVILANLRLARDEVRAYTDTGRIATGMRKLGALVGDGAEVGCNAVLQPGTILGRSSIVMSGLPYAGYLAPGYMARSSARVEEVRYRR